MAIRKTGTKIEKTVKYNNINQEMEMFCLKYLQFCPVQGKRLMFINVRTPDSREEEKTGHNQEMVFCLLRSKSKLLPVTSNCCCASVYLLTLRLLCVLPFVRNLGSRMVTSA